MSMRRIPFAIGEWYHCYNRGVDKRIIYQETPDYERFLQLLYLTNASAAVHRSNIYVHGTDAIIMLPRAEPLVSIAAYCLMPNHFHLLVQEIIEGGITAFMQKLGTAYSMYFNIKKNRTGNLFNKPFRSRHIEDDRYLQVVARYIHMNPAELYEPHWKKGEVKNIRALETLLSSYRYSSLVDYTKHKRLLKRILGNEGFDTIESVTVREMLEDAREYYAELAATDSFFSPA